MSVLPIWFRNPRSYIEDLKTGEWGEKQVRRLLLTNNDFLNRVLHLSVKYIGKPTLKKSPIHNGDIDILVTIPPFEVKTRGPKYMNRNDILIELEHTYSFTEKTALGWYYLQKSPVLIYVWRDEEQTKLLDGYIILIKDPKLADLVSKYKNDLSRIIEAGPTWVRHGQQVTRNLSIKINEFPFGTIEHISLFNTESKIGMVKASELFE